MKNIMITGAGGFLGREILSQADNHEGISFYAVSSQTDKLKSILKHTGNIVLLPIADVERCFASTNFDCLVHAAFPRNYSGVDMATGLKYFADILDMAVKYKVKNIINISSQSVYDQKRTTPANENTALSLDSSYAVGKYSTELMINSMSRGIPCTNLRMASLIGPDFDQRLTNKFVCSAISGKDITIMDGRQRFGFLDVTDAVSGILCILRSNADKWDNVYNLGTDESHSLLEIAKIVCDTALEFGLPPIRIKTTEADLWQNSALNCGKIYRHFGWRAKKTLKSSIESIFAEKLNRGYVTEH